MNAMHLSNTREAVAIDHNEELLTEVLAYRHEKLLDRMVRKENMTRDEAEEVFEDTKKFLYLCGASNKAVLAPTEEIDNCWHNFLLYTYDYPRFCQRFFGAYIHHSPMTPEEVREDEGNMMFRTKATAEAFFGASSLSKNWAYSGAPNSCGSKCGGEVEVEGMQITV